MTALNRVFIKAFRRRAAEANLPKPQPVSEPTVDREAVVKPAPAPEPVETEEPEISSSISWQWPAICHAIHESATEGFSTLAAEIQKLAQQAELPVVAVAGAQREVGATSVLLTLAKVLTERVSGPVLVLEANSSRPSLFERMEVEGDHQTPERVNQRRTLEEGRLAIGRLSSTDDVKSILEQAAAENAIVLLDSGCVGSDVDAPQLWQSESVAVAVLVDFDDRPPQRRNRAVEYLNSHAQTFLGVIENRRENLPQTKRRRLTG